jgi:glutamine---fructose-6-phosphate transaminase (isomerizing)
MQKEIHEQVRALTDTLAGRVDFEDGKIRLPELNLTPELAKRIQKIFITACGTAAYAGMVGKILIERIARVPGRVDIARSSATATRLWMKTRSCWRFPVGRNGRYAGGDGRRPPEGRDGAVVIVNAIGSQAMRVADGYISMQVGPEIGVASTKAFTAPLVDLYMLAIAGRPARDADENQRRRALVPTWRWSPTWWAAAWTARPRWRRWRRRSRHAPLPVPGARHQYADCL